MEKSGVMHNENQCPLDIWAPDHRCSMNNTAFSAYTLHQQQIEDFINLLAGCKEPNDLLAQTIAYKKAKLDPNSLSKDDIQYIEYQVAERWRG